MRRLIAIILVVVFSAYIGIVSNIAFGSTPNVRCCRYFNGCQRTCEKVVITVDGTKLNILQV